MTNKKILTLITLLLFLLLVAGCDVIKPNQPPVITSDPVETATAGVDYIYNVVATDPNTGDVLTYSLTTEPEGMLIDEDSGVITWKADDITAAGIGDHDVVVEVKDDRGLSDSQDFTITVSEFVVELVGIKVDPEEMTLLCLPEDGDSDTFEVTADYNDGSTADVTSECVYGISDINIATVETGVVTALNVGIATISISYTEGDITKGTTLNIIVEGTVTVRWLEDVVRFYADNSFHSAWQNDLIPPLEYPANTPSGYPEGAPSGPAVLILTNGEYHFADAKEYYNVWATLDTKGNIVIDGIGQLFGDTTYTSPNSGLPIRDHFEGEVVIIIYGEEEVERDHDGTMVGTYTQWSYAFGTEEQVLETGGEGAVNFEGYLHAVLAPEQGPDWWFVGRTEYIAHGEEKSH